MADDLPPLLSLWKTTCKMTNKHSEKQGKGEGGIDELSQTGPSVSRMAESWAEVLKAVFPVASPSVPKDRSFHLLSRDDPHLSRSWNVGSEGNPGSNLGNQVNIIHIRE